MAETKGINIKFFGETVEFDKSLDGVNKALKTTKSELTTLNKQLKLDPSSVEKLTSKFNNLTQQQDLLNEKIKYLKTSLSEMSKEEIGSKEWEKLTKELNNAEVELARVNDLLKNMPTANVQALAKKLEETSKTLEKIGDSVENVAKKFMVLTGAITGLATAGVAYNAELERQTALFTTLTGSAEEAERILSAIKNDALKSPFDTQSLISANQYLLSAGEEADNSRELILALGNAISATGGGNSELQRMAQNLQQVKNVGKATTMDIRQFGMAGIDIYGILADYLGKTAGEVQNMTITFDMLNGAFLKASQEGGKYFGAMEAQSDTLNGKISKLKATFQELLGQLTETLVPVIKDLTDYLQNWVDRLKALDDAQKNTIAKVAGIAAAIGPVLLVIGKITKAVGSLMGFVSNFITNPVFLGFIEKVATAGGGLSGVIAVIGEKLAVLVNPITAVIAVLAVLYAKSETFRNAVNGLVKTLGQSLLPMWMKVKNSLNQIIKAFETLVSSIKDALKPVIDRVVQSLAQFLNTIGMIARTLLQALYPVFVTVINILTKLITTIIGVYTSLVDKLKPAITFVTQVAQLMANIFNSFAVMMGGIVLGGIKLVSSALSSIKSVIDSVISWVQKMYDKFANTTWGQKFIDIINRIKSVIDGVKSAFSWLTDFMDKLINKTNTVIGQQTRVNQISKTGNSSAMLQSGGIGLTMNIHVDNNGTPIDENEINRWADLMTDRLDLALGRRL